MRRLYSLALLLSLATTAAAQPIPIEEARTRPLGTVVTVSGFISVADQFGGPAYLQDGTAGMAVYHPDLHAAAVIGDSVVVTGPLTEFQASSGQKGSGLFQISGAGTTFEVFKNVNRPPQPRVVTIADLSEALEGQLVLIQNATIGHTGAFQGNVNYTLTDATSTTELRIDNTTDLVGAMAPSGVTNVIGVVSEFRGTRQVLPRFLADLGVEGYTIPFEDVPRSQTFEIGTWNLRWFGDPNQRPDDDALALRNVVRVLREIEPDVMALQEIVSAAQFAALVDSLPGYRGFIAPITTQPQKTAFLYNTATVDSVGAAFYLTTGDWANERFPYAFTFDATVNGETARFTAINVHFKATLSNTATNDYFRRLADARQLKTALDTRNPDDAVFVIGDFNDDVDLSTVQNRPTPYAEFVNDPENYRFLTATLSERGFQSISGGQMIDHILATDEVLPFHLEGTERVENPAYVGSYLSTTSDHYPVWVRLQIGEITANEHVEAPSALALDAPFPSPARDVVTLAYHLHAPAQARLDVFDLLGRRVATLLDAPAPAGTSSATFDVSTLPAGVYVVRLSAAGESVTRMLVRL